MKKSLLFSAFLLTAGLMQAQITNGLVAKYSFNGGNANDEIGTNHGLVNNATLSTDRFGNANKSYTFNGSTSSISLGTSSVIHPTVGSISLWANITGLSNSGTGYNYNPIFVMKNTGGASSYFEGCALYARITDGRGAVVATDYSTITERYFFTANPMTPNAWTHYVVTYGNDSLALYINGQLENKIYKGFASTFSTLDPFLLGNSDVASNNRYFTGSIDDVAIYNRVLSAAEVNALFTEVDPTTGVATINTTNAVAINPNPTTGVLTLSATSDVKVTDITGRVVLTALNATTVDLSNEAAGMYFVLLTNDKGELVQSNKIIKE